MKSYSNLQILGIDNIYDIVDNNSQNSIFVLLFLFFPKPLPIYLGE